LKVIGQQLDIPVFDMGTDTDPVEIVRRGLEQAKENKNDYVFIDTAGRLHIDEHLMDELKRIKEFAQPNEILLTVDAMTGQDAVTVAQSFDEQLDVTGVVLTKLDGDTRGGAALSIRAITGKPIKFIGTGEKLTDVEVFHPDRMSSRILGMGDMLTLIEKAQQEYDEEKAEELAQKMRENSFDFNDFIEQLDQVMGMGPLEDLLKMIPGMNNMPGLDQINIDPKDVARKKAIVFSMTPQERENPELLNPSRRRRIAAGSGNSVVEVNRMIKQFNESRKMMQQMSKGNMPAGMENLMGNGVQGKLGKMAMNKMIKKNKKKMNKNKKKNKKKK
ncbi:MAG: signal recognition particle protein, partial [Vagococcus sp.]